MAPMIGVPVSAAIAMVENAMPILSPENQFPSTGCSQKDGILCLDSPISFIRFVKPAMHAGIAETGGPHVVSSDKSIQTQIEARRHCEPTVCSGEESKKDQEGYSPTTTPALRGRIRQNGYNAEGTYTLVVASQTMIKIPVTLTHGMRTLDATTAPR
jgi:hypothetical protein